MATNFLQQGKALTAPAPVGGILSGQGCLFGKLFGVAATDGAAGEATAFSLEGVWDLPKVSTETWSLGEVLYWDDAAKAVTEVATSNTKIGCAFAAAANGTTAGAVRLNGSVD